MTRRPPALKPKTRKFVLLVHGISALGWLGLNIGNLTLELTGVFTTDPTTQHAVYRVLGLLADTLLIPISLIAFTTGVLLSVGTHWGLLRHWWIVVKFALTLIAVVLIPLSLLPGIHDLVDLVDATPADQLVERGGAAVQLITAGCVSTTMYVTNAVLSVYTPWGRTAYGKRRLAAA